MPLPRLLPGVRYGDDVTERFRLLHIDAQNARSNAADQPVERYLSFVHTSTEQLRYIVRPDSLDRLLLTKRYWAILGMDPRTQAARELASIEMVDSIERFAVATRSLQADWARWEYAGALLVPDTNVFLHALGDTIAATDWRGLVPALPSGAVVTVVIPIAVIDQLDRTKHDRYRVKASKTLNELDGLLSGTLTAQLSSDQNLTVLVSELEHVPLTDTDSEIIDRALTLQSRSSRVVLLTGDSAMTFRARQVSLTYEKLATPD